MKSTPLLIAAFGLLTACGSGGGEGNEATPSGSVEGKGANTAAPSAPIEPGDSLTGLYEAQSGGLSSQLCIVERQQGDTRFGLNIWGASMHACAGAGTVARNGNALTLTMEGDRSCSLTARIEGNAIRLPDQVPAACDYYCGKQARMAGVSLARTGSREADALKARDVVDEALCEKSPRN